ncbi:head-tail connector protein [Elizabethkingia anophelis]|uniref:head-tail connector protein n=1 Tax=Elizabethkingia anophelis TaxID=1117645 RepID=UPI003892C836
MNYDEVLPLEEVKNYLRIDTDFTEDDNDIKRMSKSALQYIEMQTNHIFSLHDKTYNNPHSNCVEVFDYPVNTQTPDDITRLDYSLKYVYNTDKITLNVGYTNRDAIPAALIDCALQIIKVWYFEHEKASNSTLIPESVKAVLYTYKRFVVC